MTFKANCFTYDGWLIKEDRKDPVFAYHFMVLNEHRTMVWNE